MTGTTRHLSIPTAKAIGERVYVVLGGVEHGMTLAEARLLQNKLWNAIGDAHWNIVRNANVNQAAPL